MSREGRAERDGVHGSSSPVIDPERIARRSRRIGCAAGVLLLLLGLAAWGRILVVDAPLPDDEDLSISWHPEPPPDENGWLVLRERAERPDTIDIDAWFEAQAPSPHIVPDGFEFDPASGAGWAESETAAAARRFIAEHESEIGLIDDCIGRPRFVVVPAAFDDFDVSEIPMMRKWYQLLQFRIEVALLDGRAGAAIADALRIVRLGGRMRSAENRLLIHGAVAIPTEVLGTQQLLRAIEAASPGEAELERIARELESLRGDESYWELVLRREYVGAREVILATPRSIAFKPHRTLGALGEGRRAELAELRRPTAERSLPQPSSDRLDRVWATLSGNSQGHALLSMSLLDLERMSLRFDCRRFERDAARIAIALRRHHLRSGQFPPTLEALVPDLLPELPVDPFTGGAIRYDPVRAILWSPGSDGIDRGGSIGDPSSIDPAEPTLRIPTP